MSASQENRNGRPPQPPASGAGERGKVESGPGALCAEAQADGVPCTELGRDCQVCSRAVISTSQAVKPTPDEAA